MTLYVFVISPTLTEFIVAHTVIQANEILRSVLQLYPGMYERAQLCATLPIIEGAHYAHVM